MTAGDEEALSWDGVADPSHAPDPAPKAKKAKDPLPATPKPVAATGPSSLLLVSYGILGGMYLLFTVGWLIAVLNGKLEVVFPDPLHLVMYRVQEAAAVVSPLLWFLMAFLLTRHRRPALRILSLVLGALLVSPLPFFVLGA